MLDHIYPLPIFPQGSLSSSVITTVWVGVFVVCFFNLRFGWVLSGLIVPGFLVPLMIAKPWSVGVIIGEAILTYLIVRTISNIGIRYGGVFEVFGRERFFALVLISVIVRVCFDGWILPELSQWINNDLGINIDFKNNLQSFGLIIIALLANTFWKPGLIRGLGSCMLMLFITYLIVRYGLTEWTNFNVSNLSYMYEDLSSSIYASPKAYIILLTTAYIASRMNMRYGWEYNGILIPSLLALQWYQPEKLLVTLVETIIILITGKILVGIPLLARMNFEGARLLLLFFNISFFYKMLIGFLLAWLYPHLKISDYFALGYLLSTLLAIKMFEKGISLKMIRVTTESSLVAVTIASIIGFALMMFVPQTITNNSQDNALSEPSPIISSEQSLAKLFVKEKIIFYQGHQNAMTNKINEHTLNIFTNNLKSLSQISESTANNLALLTNINDQLSTLGFRLISGPDYWAVIETGHGSGQGAFILAKNRPSGVTIEIPYPMSESGVLETGISLFNQLNARILIVANPTAHQQLEGNRNILRDTGSFYHQAHQQFNLQGILQIRALSSLTHHFTDSLPSNSTQNQLWVKRSLPKNISLIQLQQSIGIFDTHWGTLPITDRQQQTTYRNFTTLLLTKQALRQAINQSQPQAVTSSSTVQSINVLKQSLNKRLQAQANGFAHSGTEQYKIASIKDMRFFDQEVVSPLMDLVSQQKPYRHWSTKDKQSLSSLSQSATSFGYSITVVEDPQTQEQFLILAEPADKQHHFWGIYVFRLANSQNYVIQVPHPLLEKETLTFGLKLFHKTQANLLLVTSAHATNHTNGSANILKARNKVSLFNLIHQSWLRVHEEKPQHIIQIRAFQRNQFNQNDTSDILIAQDNLFTDYDNSPKLVSQLITDLKQQKIRYRLVDGQAVTAGYQAKQNAQKRYLAMSPNHYWSVLWLSPEYRRSLKDQRSNIPEKIQFDALAVKTVVGDLSQYLLQAPSGNTKIASFNQVFMLLIKYIDKPDILILNQLREITKQYQWLRWIDEVTGKSFLVIKTNQDAPLFVTHLHPSQKLTLGTITHLRSPIRKEDVNDYIHYGINPLLLHGALR